MYLSISKARKALIEAGAERVSDDAARALQKYIDARIHEIAKKSAMLSKHAKRKTVSVSDVELAAN